MCSLYQERTINMITKYITATSAFEFAERLQEVVQKHLNSMHQYDSICVQYVPIKLREMAILYTAVVLIWDSEVHKVQKI